MLCNLLKSNFHNTSHCLYAGSSGWWYKNEIYLLLEKGLIIAEAFIVQSSTWIGNSANSVAEWADNYVCVITGTYAFI